MKNIKTLSSLPLLALLLSLQAYGDTDTEINITEEEAVELASPTTTELEPLQQDVIADQIEQQQTIVDEQNNPHEETVTELIVQDPKDADSIKKAKAKAKKTNKKLEEEKAKTQVN